MPSGPSSEGSSGEALLVALGAGVAATEEGVAPRAPELALGWGSRLAAEVGVVAAKALGAASGVGRATGGADGAGSPRH